MRPVKAVLKLPAWFKRRCPGLDWIQVEITSQCNGDCLYCPQHAYRRQWQSRRLSLETFRSMGPAFKKTRLVHLQGWGEPFLHPDFFEMLEIAKSTGARVGTTTNGTLINSSLADRLVAGGLDIIAFSLAGISTENDRIRKGTSLNSVIRAIEDLQRSKNKYGSGLPAIHIACLLLGSQTKEIDRMPDFFAGLGVDQVVVSSLSLVTGHEWLNEAVLCETREQWTDLEAKILQAQEDGAGQGVDMHFHLVCPWADPAPCDENTNRALVVSADGNVSPCVMTNIPVKGEAVCYFDQEPHPVLPMIFGNIGEESLGEIWHSPNYRRFRRRLATVDLPELCRKCHKSRVVKIERPVAGPEYGLIPDF